MAAFRGALSRGFSFECDIQKLRSGEVVILHDDTLERTAAPWSSAPTGLDETSYRALVSAPGCTTAAYASHAPGKPAPASGSPS